MTVDCFPVEFWQLTFSYLGKTLDEKAKELCKAELVCKKWQEAASSDECWRPLLQRLSVYKSSDLSKRPMTIKKLFISLAGELKNNLFTSPFHRSALNERSLELLAKLNDDAGTKIESLIDEITSKSPEIKIVDTCMKILLLIKTTRLDSARVFEKVVLKYFEIKDHFNKCENLLILVTFTLKTLLDEKLDLSYFFNKLKTNFHPLIEAISLYQSVPFKSYIEAGLDPNLMVAWNDTYKTPLLYYLTRFCYVIPIKSYIRYRDNLKLNEFNQTLAFNPKPLQEEALLEDLKEFLKLQVDINAKDTKGVTVLNLIRHLMTLEGVVNKSYLRSIKKLLKEHGAK